MRPRQCTIKEKFESIWLIYLLSGLLFCTLFFLGLSFGVNKSLWLDEYYSLTKSIKNISYAQILSGQIPWEGNNSPFFYLTQKILCDLWPFNVEELQATRGMLVHGKLLANVNLTFYDNKFLNIYLRLISIFCMALAPAALFFYFSRRFTLLWGAYSVLLCLSTWFYWWYGLEARPYIHFFTLSTLQMLVFLEIISNEKINHKHWMFFSILNILLSLTFTTSAFQLLVMGAMIFLLNRFQLNISRIVLSFLLPGAIIIYYYVVSLKVNYWISSNPINLLLNGIPMELIILCLIYLIYLSLSWVQQHFNIFAQIQAVNFLKAQEFKYTYLVCIYVIFLSVIYLFVLSYLKSNRLQVGQGGSPFAYRYLICLVPMGIIAMTIFTRNLSMALNNRKLKILLLVIVSLVMYYRFNSTFLTVRYWIGI